ncbi:MAG: patatin-like phospholipase family protein [Desulfobacterales bacterium]|nr:patatin-like phospholipase family protein [Desulfobacterales bacterium]
MKRALILSGGGARGAFQVGVWEYLQEKGWDPDLICGTSVGAINAVAIGSGMPLEKLMHIWKTLNRRKAYHLKLLRFFGYALFGHTFKPLMDTAPLRTTIANALDLEALRRSPRDIIITAVNMLTSQVSLFDQQAIEVEHVMASSAMPLLFPWQMIDGQPHWDGGVMVNTPLFPALEQGVDEIIVVLLSPVGHSEQSVPTGVREAGEMVFEHFLLGSYQATVNPISPAFPQSKRPRIITVAPSRMLGFRSLLNFSVKQSLQLIDEGYRNAQAQLGELFKR